jgi:hypothetical protein
MQDTHYTRYLWYFNIIHHYADNGEDSNYYEQQLQCVTLISL